MPEEPITEDDIIALTRQAAEEGTVEQTEQQLIANVFALTDERRGASGQRQRRIE